MTETGTTAFVLEPATGKAVPVLRGQVIRVEQLGDGQCVDLNCFCLHVRGERFDAARTRLLHGVRPSVGDSLWSNAQEGRPLLTIVADSVGKNDLLFPACTAFEYECLAGCADHTNCHDILAEAHREWGLLPADVHDPLNLWLEAAIEADGTVSSQPVSARRGDAIELLALVDCLVVLSVCGDDVFGSSQFELKPVSVEVHAAGDDVLARWLSQENPREGSAGQSLQRDPDFEPRWQGYPVRLREHAVELEAGELELLRRLVRLGRFGHTESDVLRAAAFQWWRECSRREPAARQRDV